MAYSIQFDVNGRPLSIRCFECGLASLNEHDVYEKYCGYCHTFHEDVMVMKNEYCKVFPREFPGRYKRVG